MLGEAVYEAIVDGFKAAVDQGKSEVAHQSLSVLALLLGEGARHEWDQALDLVGEEHGNAYKKMTEVQNDPEVEEFVRPYVQEFRNAVLFNQYGNVIRFEENVAVRAMHSILQTVDDGEVSAWDAACAQIGSRYEPVFASLQSRFTRLQRPESVYLTGKDLPTLDFTKPL